MSTRSKLRRDQFLPSRAQSTRVTPITARPTNAKTLPPDQQHRFIRAVNRLEGLRGWVVGESYPAAARRGRWRGEPMQGNVGSDRLLVVRAATKLASFSASP
jgi:hypothetical protein